MTAFIAALGFILILEIAEPVGSGSSREIRAVGLFLGLVFLAHPVQTYVVDYIWQRTALLSCFFYVSALVAYLATRSGRIRYTTAGYALCVTLFCLALMSKENVITLPVILILAEIAFFGGGWKGLFKRAGVFAVILLALVGFLSILERPHGIGSESIGIFGTVAKYYDESSLTLFQLIISQCRVLFSYLALIVAPVPSNVHFTTAHVIFSSPLESPIIVVATLGAFSILGMGIYLLRKRPLTGLGLLFFVINLMPESFLVPQYLFFAYRATLPMFGLLLVLADGLLEVLAKTRSLREQKWYLGPVAAGLLAAVLVALMSSVTVSKAKLWQDTVRFWTDVVEELPFSEQHLEKRIRVHALNNLGVALQSQDKNEEARNILRRAVRINPSYSPSYVNLAALYEGLGEIPEAESSLKKAVEIDPDSVEGQFALAQFYLRQDRLSAASLHMQKALDLAPSDPTCLNGLGTVLLRQDNASEAASVFRSAIDFTPGFAEAHYNLGEAYVRLGMDKEAAVQFNQALDLNRTNWQAHNSLGLLLAKSGHEREAEAHFHKALALSPRNWRIHNNLGVLLAKSGNLRDAAAHFEKALRHNPEDVLARKNLDRLRTLMGSPSAK
jgi:protein O-mannosyl-transferase